MSKAPQLTPEEQSEAAALAIHGPHVTSILKAAGRFLPPAPPRETPLPGCIAEHQRQAELRARLQASRDPEERKAIAEEMDRKAPPPDVDYSARGDQSLPLWKVTLPGLPAALLRAGDRWEALVSFLELSGVAGWPQSKPSIERVEGGAG